MAVVGENKTFRILSCIGILLIVLGHLNCNYLELGGLFPYYSYHVMMFVFISGYFYRDEEESNVLKYILRKLKKLILPYMIINMVFGLAIQGLHRLGFAYGGDLSIETLIIAPFTDGHQFGLNAPGWFIPALFLLEICNVAGRAVLRRLKLENEFLIMGVYLAMGLLCIALSMRGMVYDYYRVPARIMFMAPVFQLGRLYRTRIEGYDTLNSVLYFVIVVGINVVLHFIPIGLAYSAAWVNGFANIVLPYVTTITGIALWLRVSSLISNMWKTGKGWSIVEYLGKNTFSVCLFHLSVFLAINGILDKAGVTGFDSERYMYDIYYVYEGWGNWFKLVYAIAGIAIVLVGCWCFDRIKEKICG